MWPVHRSRPTSGPPMIDLALWNRNLFRFQCTYIFINHKSVNQLSINQFFWSINHIITQNESYRNWKAVCSEQCSSNHLATDHSVAIGLDSRDMMASGVAVPSRLRGSDSESNESDQELREILQIMQMCSIANHCFLPFPIILFLKILLILLTDGKFALSQMSLLMSLSLISQAKMPGSARFSSRMYSTTFGVVTLGRDPPMVPGIIVPFSENLVRIFETHPWLILSWREMSPGMGALRSRRGSATYMVWFLALPTRQSCISSQSEADARSRKPRRADWLLQFSGERSEVLEEEEVFGNTGLATKTYRNPRHRKARKTWTLKKRTKKQNWSRRRREDDGRPSTVELLRSSCSSECDCESRSDGTNGPWEGPPPTE